MPREMLTAPLGSRCDRGRAVAAGRVGRTELPAWFAVLVAVWGCAHEATTGALTVPREGELGVGFMMVVENPFSYRPGPEEPGPWFEIPFGVVPARQSGPVMVWGGFSVVWRHIWHHGYVAASREAFMDAHWRVRLDLLTGGGIIFLSDGTELAPSLGARLRFRTGKHDCVDLTYRWIPVEIDVPGGEVTDLGGLGISIGSEW